MKKVSALAVLVITIFTLMTGCDVQRPVTRDMMNTTTTTQSIDCVR